MATIQQIKDAINNANTLGRTNLAEKGVTVGDTATTYQIMQKISELTDAFIITVTGHDRGDCTIDKTYAEILSAAQAGKTIVMVDPITIFKPAELPLILTPYSVNSDRSGTFMTITRMYEDIDMRYYEYRYSITVYPDNTATVSWEELSQGGTEYTNIVYNEDNTVTLTDKDGVVHTMSCTYEDGKLTGVNYDGEAVDLTYNGDVLVNVGKTNISGMDKIPSPKNSSSFLSVNDVPNYKIKVNTNLNIQ